MQLWPNFKAQWVQYYHNCAELTDLERFIKLDEFIVPHSEPFGLIANYDRALVGSYQDAWMYLCERYDNPRRQVNDIICKFITTPQSTPTRDGLLRLSNAINHLTSALPRMNINVDTWDPILMHILECKLDQETFDQWRRCRNAREIARLEPFVTFLNHEIDRLDGSARTQEHSADRNTANNRSSNRGVPNQSNTTRPKSSAQPNPSQSRRDQPRYNERDGAVGGTPSSSAKVKKPIRCPLCNGEHHLYFCTTFRRFDLSTRKAKVISLSVCENCLKPKCSPDRCTLRACRNEGCEQKHNGLLCPLTFQPTANAGQGSSE